MYGAGARCDELFDAYGIVKESRFLNLIFLEYSDELVHKISQPRNYVS